MEIPGLGSIISTVGPDGWLRGPLSIVEQTQHAMCPVSLPSVAEIFEAHRRGLLADDIAEELSSLHGVDWEPGQPPNVGHRWERAWTAAYQLGFKQPDFFLAKVAQQHGILNEEETNQLLVGIGQDRATWQDLEPLLREKLTLEQLYRLHLRGYLSLAKFNEYKRLWFHNEEMFRDARDAFFNEPGQLELNQMLLRGLITEGQWEQHLRRSGLDMGFWSPQLKGLLNIVPPPSDLVRFQVRDALNPNVANALSYYDERPINVEPWMKVHGLLWEPGFQIKSDGVDRQATWSDVYWAAHWQTISPTQAYTMMHRIRTDNIGRYAGFNVKPFTIEDVRTHLKVADYPPQIRDYLAAISFNPMRLTDIRSVLQFNPGQQTEQWAIGQLRDRGYHPDDARTAVALFVRQAEEKKKGNAVAVEKNAPKRLWQITEKAYYHGTMPRDRVRAIGQQIGLNDNAINQTLEYLDFKWIQDQHVQIVGQIKKDYMGGLISDDEMQERLLALDMVDAVRQRTVQMWRLQRGQRRRTVGAKEALELYKIGLIGEFELRRRLSNLGFDLSDSALLVARAQVEIGQAEAKALKAREREGEATAKKLEQEVMKADSLVRRLRSDLAKLTPVPKLIKWYAEDRIDEGYFRERMRVMGYSSQSIDLHFGDAVEAKRVRDEKQREQDQEREQEQDQEREQGEDNESQQDRGNEEGEEEQE